MTQTGLTCPKCGQVSSESDFCSECGARIAVGSAAASPAVTASPPDPADPQECPTCHTPRPSPAARFCEVCRYDFITQAAGAAPVVATAPPRANPAESTSTVVPNGVRWNIVIGVDPSLDTDPDPDLHAPADPERRIPLDKTENLIGRRDVGQPSVPDVLPHDPSVSRRHAKLLVRADGTVAILDLESANGTFVNGEQILAGVAHALAVDDMVTMGRWTRLRIEPRGDP
jgi:hypothetical protein